MKALSWCLDALMIALIQIFAANAPARAHGDEPHPKCKKGYVLTDDHKCVKAPT